jgi:NAD(P)-dependent dehydrogenase (short-subunit alcohol dehydrogenase family)
MMKVSTRIAPALAAGAVLVARSLRRREAIDFAGLSVVITGGSRGLGLVLARELGAEGARLTLLARNADELARAKEDLEGRGYNVDVLACDLRDQEEAQAAIEDVVQRHGRIDVLINNAGVIQAGPIEHMEIADFEDAMAVHLWGPLYTSLAAVPYMKRQGGGRIVNVSSIGGLVAVPHLLPYCASKFALVGLSDGMRAELAKDEILVTTVCPGLMRTGSHINALFKGQHRAEFAWFSIGDSLPLLSIDAERAARQIVDACRHGDPHLTITMQARVAAVVDSVAPGFMARVMMLVNRLLPGPTDDGGNEIRTGWESRSSWSPSPVTALSDRAAVENNEFQSRGDVAATVAAER